MGLAFSSEMLPDLVSQPFSVRLNAGVRYGRGEGNSDPPQYSCLENSMTEELGGLQSMGSQSIRND